MCKDKACSVGVRFVQHHFPIESGGYDAADGKSQSCALHIFVQFFETFEYGVLLVRWYAASRICDGEADQSFSSVYRVSQFNIAFLRKLGRVADQVDQYLLQAQFICVQYEVFAFR